MKPYKIKVNKRMKLFGEIIYDDNLIKINPKKGDLFSTVLHECIHEKYPDMKEREVYDLAKKLEKGIKLHHLRVLFRVARKMI